MLFTKTITNSTFLSFCNQRNLETIQAELRYCHPVQKLGC